MNPRQQTASRHSSDNLAQVLVRVLPLGAAQSVLRQFRPRVLCEIHDLQQLDDFRRRFAELGYATEHRVPPEGAAEAQQHYLLAAHVGSA